MTVKELKEILDGFMAMGHADTNVIANCEFTITQGNGYYNDKPLTHLKGVYYQSGDIELSFLDKEEYDDDGTDAGRTA